MPEPLDAPVVHVTGEVSPDAFTLSTRANRKAVNMFTHPDDHLRMHHQRARELHTKAELRRLARSGGASTSGSSLRRVASSKAGGMVLALWATSLRRQSRGHGVEPTDTQPSNARGATPRSRAPKAEATPTDVRSVGEAVAADGFDAHWTTVSSLLLDARRHGVDEILIEVVADRTAPRVARERALGRILAAMWCQHDAPVEETDQGVNILETNLAS